MRTGFLTKADSGKGGISNFSRNLREGLDVEIIRYDTDRRGPFGMTRSRVFTRDLKERLERFDTVVLEDQSLLMLDPGSVDCRLVPYVHDILPATTCYKSYDGSLRGRLKGFPSALIATRYVKFLAGCEQIICASHTTRREVESRTAFSGRADVVYQGVDNLPEVDPEGCRDIDLLYVGGLLERKAPGFLREVFGRAVDQGFKVVHVSDDPSIPGRCLQDVSDERLAELYGRCRYYLHPSFAEGFGRCPVEAQRYGAVPLARDIPVNCEVLGEKGLQWFAVGGVEDVLEFLEGDRGCRRSARLNAARFRWGRTVAEFGQVLDRF